jgi:hypothetical protein
VFHSGLQLHPRYISSYNTVRVEQPRLVTKSNHILYRWDRSQCARLPIRPKFWKLGHPESDTPKPSDVHVSAHFSSNPPSHSTTPSSPLRTSASTGYWTTTFRYIMCLISVYLHTKHQAYGRHVTLILPIVKWFITPDCNSKSYSGIPRSNRGGEKQYQPWSFFLSTGKTVELRHAMPRFVAESVVS